MINTANLSVEPRQAHSRASNSCVVKASSGEWIPRRPNTPG